MKKLVANNERYSLSKGFGVAEFGEALEKALERPTEFKQKTSFAPSGLGYAGSCARRWYYAFHGADFEYDTEAAAMQNMMAGTDSGTRIETLLENAGLLIEAEVDTYYDDPPIHGYIDALINWKGEEVVVEIKTTKTETWNRRFNDNAVPGYQLLQLLIYMYIRNTDKGVFITENKNDHRLFILPVLMTDDNRALVERTFEWMRQVKQLSDDEQLPQRPFEKSSWACKGCEVRNQCWEGFDKGTQKRPAADPNPGVVFMGPLEVPK